MKINNNFFCLGILFAIAIIIHWMWFFNFSILTYGDWFQQDTAVLLEKLNFPQIWSLDLFGVINLGESFYPFNFLSGTLAKIGFGYSFIERIVFMWPLTFMMVLSSYFLIEYVTKSKNGAMIGSLVFSYNTYMLLGKTGHLTLMAAFSIAPFVILFFIKTFDQRKFNLAVWTGLLLFITSFYEFRSFYIIVWILFFYFLFYVFIINKDFRWKNIMQVCFLAVTPMMIVLLLNVYWILGLSKTGLMTSNHIFNRGLFGDSFMNIMESITMFHPFWTGAGPSSFVVQVIPIYFWLIPIVAFSGLWFGRKNKNILFFGFVALLGIFLVKQSGAPFEGAYLWLYENLPGFNAFRESSKFYFVIALGYSVLIGSLVAWLIKRWNIGWRKKASYVIISAIAIIFLWNGKSFVTGEIGTLFVPREIPNDYLILKDFILRQNDFSRTLWVPQYSRWGIYTNKHPKISLVDVNNIIWADIISEKYLSDERKIMQIWDYQFTDKLLNSGSIRYVVVPLQDIKNDDDFFVHYGGRKNVDIRQWYINELDRLNYLNKIDIGAEELIIYENKSFRPHIYMTQQRQEDIYQKIDYQKIDFKFENSTEYKINLKNINDIAHLNFAETYHPDWKLAVGNFKWLDVITKKENFLPDENHFKNNANLNSFLIDSGYIKQNFKEGEDYKQNFDGSIDVELTLYFKPQSYFYLGAIISGATLLACLGYLGYDFYRRRKIVSLKKCNKKESEGDDGNKKKD